MKKPANLPHYMKMLNIELFLIKIELSDSLLMLDIELARLI